MNKVTDPDSLLNGIVGVLGLGKSGESAARLLNHLGAKPVFWDQKNPRAEYHDLSLFLTTVNPKLCILSPGVPKQQPLLQDWVKNGGQLWNEIELGALFLQKEKVLGVTGSLGKSTVSAWLAHALQSLDPDVFLGGNFGVPLCDYVLDVLSGKRPRSEYLVLELSSYQLESIHKLKLDGAIISNFYPNHLDRYLNFDDYCHTKWNIASLVRGPLVLNEKSQHLQDFYKKAPKTGARFTEASDEVGFADCFLKGGHNKENYALVNKLLKLLEVSEACRQKMLSFRGLEHRVEYFLEKNQVTFVNDSKSTTIESVLRALESVKESKPSGVIWLLLGGRDKDLPWAELQALKGEPRLRFLVFGEAREKIADMTGLPCKKFDKLEQLVEVLPELVAPGDCVLLSPGGSSLDEFSNFEERGKFFKKNVERVFS